MKIKIKRELYKEKNNQNNDQEKIMEQINKKRSSLNTTQRLYNDANNDFQLLRDLQYLYPQYIIALDILRQLQLLVPANVNYRPTTTYEKIIKIPENIQEEIKKIIEEIKMPTGNILIKYPQLKFYVDKIKKVFEFLEISIDEKKLINCDDFCDNQEFINNINISLNEKRQRRR